MARNKEFQGRRSGAGEKYRCSPIFATSFGSDLSAVAVKRLRKAVLLRRPVLNGLLQCAVFRTIDDHAERIWDSVQSGGGEPPFHSVEEVRRELASAAGAGLLLMLSGIGKLCRTKRYGTEAPAIASVAAPTSDRPEQLERALTTFIENTRDFGRRPDFVIVDDSRDSRNLEANRAMLRRMRSRYGVPVRYAGPPEKQRFAGELAREAGIRPDILEFALADPEDCGYTCGANRNGVLMDTAGDLFVSLDDDVVCDIYRRAEASDGLAFGSAYDPRTFRFFSDREEARRSLVSTNADFLGIHSRFLGRTVPCCLAGRDPDGVDLQAADALFLDSILSGEGRVVATMPGLVGDNGMGTCTRIMWLEGESFGDLTASAESYRNRLSREVTRTVPCAAISNDSFFMTTCFGLDNRDFVPPFLPVNRNTDGLMGKLLRLTGPQSLFGYLPEALLHTPAGPRTATAAEFTTFAGHTTSYSINMLLDRLPGRPATVSREESLGRIGDYLKDLASMPLYEFCELFRMMHLGWLSSTIRDGAQSISVHQQNTGGGIPLWAADLRQLGGSLLAAARNPWSMTPRDLGRGGEPKEAMARLQRITGRFGELMCAWPEIHRAAKRLRAKEKRLANPLT